MGGDARRPGIVGLQRPAAQQRVTLAPDGGGAADSDLGLAGDGGDPRALQRLVEGDGWGISGTSTTPRPGPPACW